MAEGPSAALGTIAARQQRKEQEAWTERVLKNQKQWLYDDLRAAGINPILAVDSGASQVAPTIGTPGVSAGGEDIGSQVRAGQLQKKTLEKLEAEAATAKEQKKLAEFVNVYEGSKARWWASEEGQRTLRDNLQNEADFGPFRGVGLAGITAGTTAKGLREGKIFFEDNENYIEDKIRRFERQTGIKFPRNLQDAEENAQQVKKMIDDLYSKGKIWLHEGFRRTKNWAEGR